MQHRGKVLLGLARIPASEVIAFRRFQWSWQTDVFKFEEGATILVGYKFLGKFVDYIVSSIQTRWALYSEVVMKPHGWMI